RPSGLAALNPFNPSPETRDPVEQELARLTQGNYRVEPGFVGKNVSAYGQPVELNDEQQRRYQSLAGYLSYQMLSLLVGSGAWDSLSDSQKAKAIDDIYNKSGDFVRTQMEPSLIGQAVDSKILEMRQHAQTPPRATATP